MTAPIFQATFLGSSQTAGNDLTAYVSSASDIPASTVAFTRRTDAPNYPILFTTAGRARNGSTVGSYNARYLGNVTATQDAMDFQFDLYCASITSQACTGIILGDDATGNNYLEILTWIVGSTNGFHATNHVGGGSTDIATPSFTFVAGNSYTVLAQFRGASPSLTMNLLAGPKGATVAAGTLTTLSSGIACPNLVVSGRKFGLRTSGNYASSDTAGVHVDNLMATPYSTAPVFTLSPTTATIGSSVSVTATGTNTSWTSSTTFSVSGGTAASISGLSINVSTQVATFTLNPGTAPATLTISDSTDSATATLSVPALASGTVSSTSTSSTSIALAVTAATGGKTPYSYQFQQAPDNSGVAGTYARCV